MPVLYSWRLEDLLVTVTPLIGLPITIEGIDDEKFSFAADANLWEDKIDTAGNVYRHYNPDRRAMATLNVPFEHKINELLTGIAVSVDLPIPLPNTDLVSFNVTHRKTAKPYIISPKSWIQKLPDTSGKNQPDSIKWGIRLPFPKVFYAGLDASI